MATKNTLTVELADGVSRWHYEDTTLEPGRHEINVRGKRELKQAITDAADAGALVIVEED